MACKFEKKINAYLDGELRKEEFHRVRDHLKECSECQNSLRDIIKVNNFLSKYKNDSVPEYINEAIFEKTGIIKINSWKRKLVNFSIAASIAFAFFTGIFISNKTFSDYEYTNDLDFASESLYSYLGGE